MTTNAFRRFILAIVVAAPVLISAQQAARPPALAASGDMIDRLFGRREFSPSPAPLP